MRIRMSGLMLGTRKRRRRVEMRVRNLGPRRVDK